MKDSIRLKLENLQDRFDELEALMSDAEIITDQNRFRELSKEYSEIEDVVKSFERFNEVSDNLGEAKEMQKDSDPEIRAMAEEEISSSSEELEALELDLQKLLLPKDSKDSCNVFLEIRAGTGGDEAAIFSGDLFRMYNRYAEEQKCRAESILLLVQWPSCRKLKKSMRLISTKMICVSTHSAPVVQAVSTLIKPTVQFV